MIARWLIDDQMMIKRLSEDEYGMIERWLSDDHMMNKGWLWNDCKKITRWRKDNLGWLRDNKMIIRWS